MEGTTPRSQKEMPTVHDVEEVYQYAPLSSGSDIRLLTIEPACDGSEYIRCRLTLTSNLWNDEYQTLSYAWGPTYDDGSHLTHHVVCEGRLIPVTANLHEALLQIRLDYAFNKVDSSELPLWCDAVCVNQADIDERSTQVRLMGEIFASSRRLIMWLGNFVRKAESTAFRQLLDDDTPDELRNTNPQSVTQQQHSSIMKDILAKPYFTRRWVIQEVNLTQEARRWIFLGDQAFPYQMLERAVHRLQLRHMATFFDYWSWEYDHEPDGSTFRHSGSQLRSLLRNLDSLQRSGLFR
ncbi:hypothetical protein LTR56_005307 [Elasticomyces elasticus]|nr:hypothetical protein LTR56_005307 [Elasticomyces elasticus]KAK3663199.1 hypothetical protein LTR22_005857 [Elasticomyces elasticus]KAK4929143.1 hypothetical protein LTR49_004340 [Elasticomyces elasticus]